MKKTIAILLGLFLPVFANAGAFIVPQGGTGVTTFPANYLLVGNGTGALTNTQSYTGTSTISGGLQVNGALIAGSLQTPISGIVTGTGNCFAINASLFYDCTNGRLGVSSSTPLSTLSVSGVAGTKPFTVASSSGLAMLTVLPSGNVGVNTSNPLKTFQVNGDLMLYNNTDTTNSPYFTTGGNRDLQLFIQGQGRYIFGQGSLAPNAGYTPSLGLVASPFLSLNVGTGNSTLVGTTTVGTTTAWAKFGVQGTVGNTAPIFDVATTTSATTFATTSALRVNADGSVSINGQANAAANKLSVNGGIYSTSAVEGLGGGYFDTQKISITPYFDSIAIRLTSDRQINWSVGGAGSTGDTGISRLGTSTVAIGNAGARNITGTLIARSVGLGTTTPFALLSIQGAYGSTTAMFDIATTTSAGFATSSLFKVDYTGQVTVATSTVSTSRTTGALVVNGGLGVGGAIYSTSWNNPNGNTSIGDDVITRVVYTSNSIRLQSANPLSWNSDSVISRFSAGTLQVGTSLSLNNNLGTLVAYKLGAGTTTPSAFMSVQGAYGSTTPLFDVATTTSSIFATSSVFKVNYDGNVTISATTTTGALKVTGPIQDSTNAIGTSGQVLSSTGTSTKWIASSGGSGTSTPNTLSVFPSTVGYVNQNAKAMTTNTTMYVGRVSIPQPISATQLSFNVYTVSSAGTVKVALFSDDGATKVLEFTTASISGGGVVTTTFASTDIPQGTYYLAILPVGSTSLSPYIYSALASVNDLNAPSGKPVVSGKLTVTADTIPSTITPSSITAETNCVIVTRIDN